MPFDQTIKQFDDGIKDFFKRLELNHIICIAPLDKNGTTWTEEMCNDFLKDKQHRLPISNLFLLNDFRNKNIKIQEDEYAELDHSLKHFAKIINKATDEFYEGDGNLYDLNGLIRKTMLILDKKIEVMNYDAWLRQTYENDNDDIYFLRLGEKLIPKSKTEIDITSRCMFLVNYNFEYRSKLLFSLKCLLVEIYSERLLLPTIGINPKITYTCTPTDICELLLALSNYGVIDNLDSLKAILLDMFQISDVEYNNASHAIRNRKITKSSFIRKLADNLDKIPTSKKNPPLSNKL